MGVLNRKAAMKAIGIFASARKLALLSHPSPQISAAGHVRVRTVEVGVCGTDREICAFGYGVPPAGAEYLILGHEAVGEVVEIGAGVSDLRIGDWVVPSVRRPCPHAHCMPCAEARQDFCSTGDFVERGIKEAHGFMTEFFVEDRRHLFRVPAGLRDVAVLVEPLTVAEKAIAQIEQVQCRLPWRAGEGALGAGKTAVVLGAGPIGLLGAIALVARGFRTFVYSRSPAPHVKAEVCEAVGAAYVASSVVGVDELGRMTGGVDVIYEALGAGNVAFEAMKLLNSNGVFVFTGIPPRRPAIPFDADGLMRDLVLKNQAVIGTVNADEVAFDAAIRDLGEFKARWPDAIGRIVTGRHSPDAFGDLLLRPTTGIKDLIAFT